MASKSILRHSAIEEFFGKFYANSISRGENHLESGHLKSFTYDADLQTAIAKVLASQRDASYNVTVHFTRTKIISASCTCTRGQHVCSHLGAVVLHINKNLSVTDAACSWSVRNQKREKNLKPIPCKDFKAFTSAVDSKSHFSNVDFCKGAALSAYWLLKDEPVRNEEILPLVNPQEIIFSQAYKEAPCKVTFLDEQLGVDWNTIQHIAEITKEQSSNPLWIKCRNLRLTASRFGDILAIYNRASNRQKPSKSLLKSLHKPPNLDKIIPTQWGRAHENVAIGQLKEKYGTEVVKTGIWLDECGYLGASPDGLIGDEAVCEVKCPYSLRDYDLKDVCMSGKGHFLFMENNNWHIDTTHKYYHQIQAEMYFSKRSFCMFIAWTPKSMVVKKIYADQLWPEICLPILKEFYFKEFVPYVQSEVLSTSQ